MRSSTPDNRCGYVALVGRPNVGKSTLLNYLIQQKISITSRKPQTTRLPILGIKTRGSNQIIIVDTPGHNSNTKLAISHYIRQITTQLLTSVDIIVMVTDRLHWTEEDQLILKRIQETQQKNRRDNQRISTLILAINKIDRLTKKNLLLPHIECLREQVAVDIVPLSALKRQNLEQLEQLIIQALPVAPFLYPSDQVTSHSQRFLVAEIIREKIIRQLGDELPYANSVTLSRFETIKAIIHIDALILVERKGQKSIVIGKQGQRLKKIGSAARKDIEALLDSKVMLSLWVKTASTSSGSKPSLQTKGHG